MDVAEVITKMHQAGFTLAANGDRLSVSPADRLSDQQRQFIREYKPAILDALRSPGTILDADQAGNDIESANDPDRALIHVQELRLASGKRISCDMTVPKANIDRLRAVIKFRLKDGQWGGSLLGSPGTTEGELKEMLVEKYGQRLATIDGQPAPVPAWIEPMTCKDLNQRHAGSHDAEGAVLDDEFAVLQDGSLEREEPNGITRLMRSDCETGKTLRRILAKQGVGKTLTPAETLFLSTVEIWDREQPKVSDAIDGEFAEVTHG